MHIVRWLMSHPIIAAWLLAGLAILLNFDSGSHKGDEHKAATNDSHVEQGHEQAALHNAEATAVTTAKNAAPTAATHAAPMATLADHSATTAPAAPKAAAPQNASGSAEHSATAIEIVAGNPAPVITGKNAAGQVSALPTPTSQAVAVAPITAQEAASPQTTNTSLSGKAPAELLQMARQAYQDKNMNSSVAAYQALIKLEPSKIEYKGELGNVYYHQNKQTEAANMYAEIALPLIDQGKSEQVSNMLGFIGAFHPQKAAKISKYIQAHQSK